MVSVSLGAGCGATGSKRTRKKRGAAGVIGERQPADTVGVRADVDGSLCGDVNVGVRAHTPRDRGLRELEPGGRFLSVTGSHPADTTPRSMLRTPKSA